MFYEDEFEGGVLMGAVKKIEEPIDISFLLLMKYRKPVISLSELLPDYLPHLTIEQANKRANKCTLPFPAFKSDGRNSPFYVHLSDVAFWLDSMQKDSKRDWQAMNE